MRLSFGPFCIDSRLHGVMRNGSPVALSPKAFRLLQILIEARPAPVPREVIYDRLWPKTFVEAGNLHNLVSELRRALDDRDHIIVRTVHGTGYAFDAREVRTDVAASRFVVWIGEDLVHLTAGENIVGRDPDCAVVIDSPDVSRRHARLYVNDDHVTVEDLGSKNGTFVENVRIDHSVVVRAPEEIVIGKRRVLLRIRGSVQSTVTAE